MICNCHALCNVKRAAPVVPCSTRPGLHCEWVVAWCLLTGLELENRQAAWHLSRHKLTKVLGFRAFIEQTVPDEGDEIVEFFRGQLDRNAKDRVEPLQDRLNRPNAVSEICR